MTMTHQPTDIIGTVPAQLFIDGLWSDGESTFPVYDPATGDELAQVADANAADALRAQSAAQSAQAKWSHTSPHDRAQILSRAAQLVRDDRERLATIMTLEMGKPLAEARGEVEYAAKFFQWFAEEAVRIHGNHALSPQSRNHILTVREPVGPTLLITPWNFPLAMGARKVGPAIAAGCTMVFKPAAQTPLSSVCLAQILDEAGLPSGVLNLVTTSKAGEVVKPLLEGGAIRKISFTGSTRTGSLLLEQAAKTIVRSSMELGGNAPFIVFDDADLETAVDAAMAAKMRNMGEACTAANRIFVHETVREEFTSRLVARFAELTVGNGLDEGVDVGSLIDEAGRDKVQHLVDDAVAKGASVLSGGQPLYSPGTFYQPTILDNVPDDAEILHTEVFGPVAPIIGFTDETDVVAAANDTEWGLVGYVITRDSERINRLMNDLEVGMVGVNTGIVSDVAAPFGGIKQSGLGREGGHLGIEEFLNHKYIAIPAPGMA